MKRACGFQAIDHGSTGLEKAREESKRDKRIENNSWKWMRKIMWMKMDIYFRI